MSRFSNRLRDLIDTMYNGNCARFAQASGVGESTVSRLVRDLFTAHAETVSTLADHLPTEQAASLCAAWLEDLVPQPLVYAVTVRLTSASEAMVMRDADTRDPLADLDAPTRSAITDLAQLSIRSPEARDAIISAAAFVRGEATLSTAAAVAVQAAQGRARKSTSSRSAK